MNGCLRWAVYALYWLTYARESEMPLVKRGANGDMFIEPYDVLSKEMNVLSAHPVTTEERLCHEELESHQTRLSSTRTGKCPASTSNVPA